MDRWFHSFGAKTEKLTENQIISYNFWSANYSQTGQMTIKNALKP